MMLSRVVRTSRTSLVTPRLARPVVAQPLARTASSAPLPGTAASPAAEEIAALVARSRAAQAQIAHYSQDQVDDLITAMVWSVCEDATAERIAQHTVDETRLGNYAGKFLKIHRKTRAALQDIVDEKSVGVIEELPERNIVKIAKPVGVIGALSPSTNPEATPVIKAIAAVKGRNSIIVAPHPRAQKTNALIVDLMRAAVEKMGAPPDLVLGVEAPSVAKTHELMRQCDRVLATGGSAMVAAAYSSGTPALGVGVGNAVVTVDASAELDDTADKIALSKTLDLAASCSSDNSVVCVTSAVHDALLAKLVARGGYVLDEASKSKLQAVLWVDGHINANVVAQPAEVIAEAAGFDIPSGTKFFIVPETGYGPDFPFSGEKMSVTMAFYQVPDLQSAIDLTINIQRTSGGAGHSCGIYTQDDASVMALAHAAETSRVLVNQPQAASNSGNLWNGMRQTFSLGCGSWGGNSLNHNVTWRDLVNETWVSKPLTTPKALRSDDDLFARVKGRL